MPGCPGGEVPVPAHDAEPVDDAELPGAGEQACTGRDAERVCPGPYRHAAQRTRPGPGARAVSTDLGNYLRGEQLSVIEVAQFEPEIYPLRPDLGVPAERLDDLCRGTDHGCLGRQ